MLAAVLQRQALLVRYVIVAREDVLRIPVLKEDMEAVLLMSPRGGVFSSPCIN